MMISGSNGIIKLTVPLEDGRDQKRLMRDIKIANKEKWQKQHWRTIFSCYNHSPWFEHYRDELEILYHRPFDFLLDWNLSCFEWTVKKLEWPVSISLTDSFQKSYDDMEITDRRNHILPKNYLNFEPLTYRQVFEERVGFLPNLSILDLLCCEGKNAKNLLLKNQNGC